MGRVVITGAGAVSPIGNNFEEVMEGIRDGKRGIGTIQSIDTCHLPGNVGAEVRENGKPLLTESHIDRKEIFITRAVDELIKNCRSIHRYPPEKRFIHIGAGHDYLD